MRLPSWHSQQLHDVTLVLDLPALMPAWRPPSLPILVKGSSFLWHHTRLLTFSPHQPAHISHALARCAAVAHKIDACYALPKPERLACLPGSNARQLLPCCCGIAKGACLVLGLKASMCFAVEVDHSLLVSLRRKSSGLLEPCVTSYQADNTTC